MSMNDMIYVKKMNARMNDKEKKKNHNKEKIAFVQTTLTQIKLSVKYEKCFKFAINMYDELCSK